MAIAKTSTKKIKSNIKKVWLKLFELLPGGYDPVATAEPGDWFDEQAAGCAIEFFPAYMTHIEGKFAGKPFELEPWQQALVACTFGWKRPDGTRRYREVFLFVPRKNGKSTLLGGLVNLVAFCDQEPGAQIYSAAADREQASLVYRQAKGMAMNHPELAGMIKVYNATKCIEYPGGVVYKALSADADTKHGFNTHLVVIDELHAQRDRELVDVLLTSTGTRTQPLVFYITTSDYERESICNEKHDYASKVRDGLIADPSFLPVVYEAVLDDDWTDPKTWQKANPNLGVSVKLDYLERECRRAQETPTYENTFKRLHLNIRTQTDVRWVPVETWDRCATDQDPLEWRAEMLQELAGESCFAGLDLSTTTDLTALALLFEQDDRQVVLPFFWVPEARAYEREKRDQVPYLTWVRQGLIQMTPGDVVDYDLVRQQIVELGQKYQIREIAHDRWNASQITTQLMGDGFEMVGFGQGYSSMSAPTKELEKLILAREIDHGANPVLRWMLGNAAAEIDAAGNVKLSKKKSSGRIDGLIALVMAIGRSIVTDGSGSVYEQEGFLAL